MFSVLCAVCMLCSALPVASATDISDPISEYAGQTIACQVFEENDGVLTSRSITVYIPEGTTVSEESTLLIQAASGTQSRSANGTSDILYSAKNVEITKVSKSIASAVAKQDYARLWVDININLNQFHEQLPTVMVCWRNENSGNQSNWETLPIAEWSQRIIFSTSGELMSGNSFNVYAKIATGSLQNSLIADSCFVQGATF